MTKHVRFLGLDWYVSPTHHAETWVYVSYWLFASPLILASFPDNELTSLQILAYYAYMVVVYSGSAWLIVNVLFPSYIPERRYVLGFACLMVILVCSAAGTEWLDVALGTQDHFSWRGLFYWELPNDAQNVLTIVAILAGKKFIDERQRAVALESERRQSELSRLRAQVDPHFLFNSLNVLDILIEDEPAEARRFVHHLSNLYRYLIRHRDEDLVPAADELAYARDYHYLVRQRFGNSFRLRQNLPDVALEARYLPPGSLQTALENVYKHNLATERNPVTITLEVRDGGLVVTNDFSPKPGELATHERSGSGLANLRRRYRLLTAQEAYSRRKGEHWVVRLPLLSAHLSHVPAATNAAALPEPDRT